MECLGFCELESIGYTLLYIIEKKKFNYKNEEENSVQSRIPRHVAEFW